MTAEGFAVTNLTHDKTVGMRADSEPAWSPDGQWVAFQRTGTKAPGTRLYVVRSNGTGLRTLAPSSNFAASDMHPNWSADGQSIVFSSNRTGHFELYMVKAPGIVAQRITTVPTRLTFTKPGVDNLEPAWALDGKSIAFVRHEWSTWGGIPSLPTESIYVLVLNSSITHPTYRLTDPGYGKSDGQPAWSGDSLRIAFESNRAGTEDVYVVDRKGSGLRRITPLKTNEFHPSWASLGSQMVLVSDRTGATEIYKLTVPGLGSPTQLPAMKQITFDKAPKANPTMERVFMMGPTS
jgi:TolB protein